MLHTIFDDFMILLLNLFYYV